MTLLILVFAEVLPKTLAIARTDRFALTVAAPVGWVVSMLAPIVAGVQFMVWRVLELFGVEQDQAQNPDGAHEEIRGAVELHHQEGDGGARAPRHDQRRAGPDASLPSATS